MSTSTVRRTLFVIFSFSVWSILQLLLNSFRNCNFINSFENIWNENHRWFCTSIKLPKMMWKFQFKSLKKCLVCTWNFFQSSQTDIISSCHVLMNSISLSFQKILLSRALVRVKRSFLKNIFREQKIYYEEKKHFHSLNLSSSVVFDKSRCSFIFLSWLTFLWMKKFKII